MAVDRTALFVRVPTGLSEQLAARIEQAGRSKQDVVCDLLEAQISIDASSGAGASGAAAPAGGDVSDVLDLGEVAGLLAVDQEMVLERIANGDFPGRRFGDEWRFSRTAVMHWLAGTDPLAGAPATGFASN